MSKLTDRYKPGPRDQFEYKNVESNDLGALVQEIADGDREICFIKIDPQFDDKKTYRVIVFYFEKNK